MEPVKRLFEYLRKDPITSIRYILVVSGIFVTFQNLFDCIVQDAPPHDFFLYVGVMGALTICVIFIRHNSIVCGVLAMVGILMIFDYKASSGISGGAVFLIFSKRIANNLLYSLMIYGITSITIVANHVMTGRTPADAVNVIIGYFTIYLIDYILEGVQKTL